MIVGKTVNPRRLSLAVFQQPLINAANEVAQSIKKDFEATTATWEDENKPTFGAIVDTAGGEISLLVDVESNGEIYGYVNDGTKPHLIPKAGPGVLKISEGYQPKTSPGVIGSRSGGAGDRFIIRKTQVKHPGTEGRHFDKAIAKKWKKPFKRAMEQALAKAAKASGHGG